MQKYLIVNNPEAKIMKNAIIPVVANVIDISAKEIIANIK